MSLLKVYNEPMTYHKQHFHILFLLTLTLAITTQAKTKKEEEEKKSKPAVSHPSVPKLKSDEYAVFIEDKYRIFKTKKYEELEFDTSCFKGSKPDCDAYKFSQVRPINPPPKHEAMNNFAAIACENITGRNMIALDKDRNEYNFCLFKDGSMVNSWSMYFKYNPVPVIKASE